MKKQGISRQEKGKPGMDRHRIKQYNCPVCLKPTSKKVVHNDKGYYLVCFGCGKKSKDFTKEDV